MRNLEQLQLDIDSMDKVKREALINYESNLKAYYNYFGRPQKTEDIGRIPGPSILKIIERQDSGNAEDAKYQLYMAANQARNIKTFSAGFADHYQELARNGNEFKIEMQKKFTLATACLVLFLIGAPVGSIIRKGGLGVPILVGIVFFILYYILTIVGEKWAKEGVVQIEVGLWSANVILFGVALFFMQQARRDASLFDLDFYSAALTTFRGWFQKQKPKEIISSVDEA
jgi:lipopolysaccharide export system permease protein